MKKTGAFLVRYALENLGVRYTFGIPGLHNTEIYDELASSELIRPLLVTHEAGAAFMADAVSRTGDSIGTLLVVPAAGLDVLRPVLLQLHTEPVGHTIHEGVVGGHLGHVQDGGI